MMNKQKIGTSEQRAEYTRLRDILNKRLKRLAEKGYSEEPIYYQNVRLLKKLRDITRVEELEMRLSDLHVAVYEAPTRVSDYRRQREQQVQALGSVFTDAPISDEKTKTAIVQFVADMSASAANKINYLLKNPYITRRRHDEVLQEIREDFQVWAQERGYRIL